MEKRFLGQSGLQVSAVALGGWTFGREADVRTSRRLLDVFRDQGGDLIDTAEGYGDGSSEEIIGGWLAGRRDRERVVIATKVYGRGESAERGLSRKHVIHAAEGSLRRLRTEYLDLFQTHCWDPGTPIEETISAMENLVERGLVRYIGVSNYSAWQLVLACSKSRWAYGDRVVSLQTEYSLLERTPEWELLPACQAMGVGVLAWSALGGGWLTGKHRRGAQCPTPGTRVAETAQPWQPDSFEARANERTFAIVDCLEKVASARGVSIAQVAIGWLLSKAGVVPIVGARSEEQLLENLTTDRRRLTPDDVATLDEASALPRPWLYRYIEKEGRDNERYHSAIDWD
jgi:aryl-alcohol dehydrogenase-like predicted oxidoreductase